MSPAQTETTARGPVVLAIASIRRDGGTQVRAELNSPHLDELAEAVAGGATLPPVVVFYDGAAYWLADGFHRVEAAHAAGRDDVAAEVRPGTRRDAVLHACGANAAHGLRRTNDDKRRAVLLLLRDPEWSRWSDAVIAQTCTVSDRFVAKVRAEVTPNGSESTTRRGADGRTIDTANIGRRARVEPDRTADDAPAERWAQPQAVELWCDQLVEAIGQMLALAEPGVRQALAARLVAAATQHAGAAPPAADVPPPTEPADAAPAPSAPPKSKRAARDEQRFRDALALVEGAADPKALYAAQRVVDKGPWRGRKYYSELLTACVRARARLGVAAVLAAGWFAPGDHNDSKAPKPRPWRAWVPPLPPSNDDATAPVDDDPDPERAAIQAADGCEVTP